MGGGEAADRPTELTAIATVILEKTSLILLSRSILTLSIYQKYLLLFIALCSSYVSISVNFYAHKPFRKVSKQSQWRAGGLAVGTFSC